MARPARLVPALLTLAATLAPLQAAALSCLEPDPFVAFREAQAAPEIYVVLHGRLGFDAARLAPIPVAPPPPGALMPERRSAPPFVATFKGESLGRHGFVPTDIGTVTLVPQCGDDPTFPCPPLATDEPFLIFAQRTPDGLEVEVDACPGWLFRAPPPEVLDGLAQCLRGGACETP